MGLYFSHTDAHWSYSGFHNFRTRLGNEIGIDLDKMVGFGGEVPWSTVKDPIKILLDHSDCDGHLIPGQCKKVAPRLRELVSGWPDTDYDKIQALSLAGGMDLAASRKERLKFK